ncbi:hypothetical protein [Herpetosiphon llansteffanensis]|uniref:hypothetical protein n=1 Tax=Herpetosiphon llansteffanensis TaxID=2094568 RepID=UPI000D7C8546|nr:hypothetical protein [Herpetosiphon llansteffanensis]
MQSSLDRSQPRSAQTALWLGIVFSFAFTALIWWAGQRLHAIEKLPDQGASWYYWQLPNPTLWSRVTAWGGYLLHQVTIWAAIYYAQTRVKKYTKGLQAINWFALGANALFIVLHFIQTHFWYDGLAQDVSIFSSQGSVIVMLVWILLMENSRRGLFMGKRAPIGKEIGRAARQYHGYVFSWAAIYTFWYHPMETSSGHLVGFVYMFFLLLQGSLFLTRIHVNRWWMLTQEVMVLFHGAMVAFVQAGPTGFWPMFFFGFFGIFVITQMHGLGLSKAWRWLLGGGYLALVIGIYTWRGWNKIDEIVRIPVIEYALVAVLALLIWLVLQAAKLFTRRKAVLVSDEQGT